MEYKDKIAELLSNQLNNEYIAFYFYTACAAHFGRNEVELPGLKRFFMKMAMEEISHAKGIIDYMNARYMRIKFKQLSEVTNDFSSISDVFDKSIVLEKQVLVDISKAYDFAEENKDYATTTFLDAYVMEQVKSIKELNGFKVNVDRCIEPLGLFLFDQQFNGKKK